MTRILLIAIATLGALTDAQTPADAITGRNMGL